MPIFNTEYKSYTPTFVYEYDFRNKSTTQLGNDGWTNTSGLITGSDGISYGSWHQCLNTVSGLGTVMTNAKKVTLDMQSYISYTSGGLISGLALFHDSNGTAESGYYYNYNYFEVIANQQSLYLPSHSRTTGTKNITCVFDLENKTYSGNYVGGNGAFSGTLTDAQITGIKTCGIVRLVMQTNSYIQTIKVTVEY